MVPTHRSALRLKDGPDKLPLPVDPAAASWLGRRAPATLVQITRLWGWCLDEFPVDPGEFGSNTSLPYGTPVRCLKVGISEIEKHQD